MRRDFYLLFNNYYEFCKMVENFITFRLDNHELDTLYSEYFNPTIINIEIEIRFNGWFTYITW